MLEKPRHLKYLRRRVGPEIVPLFIDMQGATSAITLIGLAQNLAKQIRSAARHSRNLELPAPEASGFNREPFQALQGWFEQLERQVPDKSFLLCLDEFERLDEVIDITRSRAPLNFLRHLFQHHKRWIVLFSGSHTPSELPIYWSDYLINTRTLRISYLEEPEARDLIVHPMADFPSIYEDQTVEEILHLTHCHPYLIQLLCYVLVDHLNRAKRQQATPQDITEVLPKVFDEGAMFFREFWYQSLTQEQRQILLDIARGEQQSIQPGSEIMRTLLQREVLEQVDGSYRFQVPLYQIYIEQMGTELLSWDS